MGSVASRRCCEALAYEPCRSGTIGFSVCLQLGIRRLVASEKDFSHVFKRDDQAAAQDQIVNRTNKLSRQLGERAEKEMDLMPFPT